MGDGARLSDARFADGLRAVLDPAADRTGHDAVLLGPGAGALWGGPPAREVGERDLAKILRDPRPPAIVAVTRVSPTLLRALRERPPTLLCLLASVPDDVVAALHGIETLRLLGPDARLSTGPGDVVACAHAADELEGLCRALGPDRIKLALSPTPAWFADLLAIGASEHTPVTGYVPTSALTTALARWARAHECQHVLVPVGVPSLSLDEPNEEDLCATVVAHTLERLTGPVFPAPRVLALVLDAIGRLPGPPPPPVEAPPGPLALWQQARRALPMTGAALGMALPEHGLSLEAPTAAFLAQRVLLRARAALDARTQRLLDVSVSDPETVERAQEVLRGATGTLTDHESKVVLRGFGLDVTRQAVASSASGASGFAERIGYPVVLKALSPDLRRRSDVGGVMLALTTAAAVRRAYSTIIDNVERRAPTARLDGVLVAEMLDEGLDIRCGGIRTGSGEVALYGVVQGVSAPLEPALGLCPLSESDALALAHAVISRTPVPALRRETDPDVAGLAELFLRLAFVFERSGSRIASVDLGPVRLVPERGYVTLDARITQRPHLDGL